MQNMKNSKSKQSPILMKSTSNWKVVRQKRSQTVRKMSGSSSQWRISHKQTVSLRLRSLQKVYNKRKERSCRPSILVKSPQCLSKQPQQHHAPDPKTQPQQRQVVQRPQVLGQLQRHHSRIQAVHYTIQNANGSLTGRLH